MESSLIVDEGFIPGVFCAFEGTLVRNGELYFELFLHLGDLSKMKEVFLFTDGNQEDLKNFLISEGVPWKLISPEDLYKKKLEIVFSAEGHLSFREKYQTKVKSYNFITDFN